MYDADDMSALGYAYAALVSDRIPSFLALLYGHMSNYQSRGVFSSTEQMSFYGEGHYRNYFGNFSELDTNYCVPASMLVTYMTKWMLVFEERDDNALWVAKGAPRRWFNASSYTGGEPFVGFGVTAAPTRFGTVEYRMDVSASVQGVVVLNL